MHPTEFERAKQENFDNFIVRDLIIDCILYPLYYCRQNWFHIYTYCNY